MAVILGRLLVLAMTLALVNAQQADLSMFTSNLVPGSFRVAVTDQDDLGRTLTASPVQNTNGGNNIPGSIPRILRINDQLNPGSVTSWLTTGALGRSPTPRPPQLSPSASNSALSRPASTSFLSFPSSPASSDLLTSRIMSYRLPSLQEILTEVVRESATMARALTETTGSSPVSAVPSGQPPAIPAATGTVTTPNQAASGGGIRAPETIAQSSADLFRILLDVRRQAGNMVFPALQVLQSTDSAATLPQTAGQQTSSGSQPDTTPETTTTSPVIETTTQSVDTSSDSGLQPVTQSPEEGNDLALPSDTKSGKNDNEDSQIVLLTSSQTDVQGTSGDGNGGPATNGSDTSSLFLLQGVSVLTPTPQGIKVTILNRNNKVIEDLVAGYSLDLATKKVIYSGLDPATSRRGQGAGNTFYTVNVDRTLGILTLDPVSVNLNKFLPGEIQQQSLAGVSRGALSTSTDRVTGPQIAGGFQSVFESPASSGSGVRVTGDQSGVTSSGTQSPGDVSFGTQSPGDVSLETQSPEDQSNTMTTTSSEATSSPVFADSQTSTTTMGQTATESTTTQFPASVEIPETEGSDEQELGDFDFEMTTPTSPYLGTTPNSAVWMTPGRTPTLAGAYEALVSLADNPVLKEALVGNGFQALNVTSADMKAALDYLVQVLALPASTSTSASSSDQVIVRDLTPDSASAGASFT